MPPAPHTQERSASAGAVREVSSRTPGSVWLQIGDFLFGVIRLNAAIAVSCLPLVVALVAPADPLSSFPVVLFGAFLSSPGIAATFAAFRDMPAFEIGPEALRDGFSTSSVSAPAHWEEGDTAVFRPFLRAWRSLAVRSLAVAALPLGLALVLGVDGVWAANRVDDLGTMGGGVAAMLAVLVVFCLSVWLIALVFVTELRGGTWHVVVRAAAACAARKWYLSLFSVVVLSVLVGGLMLQPILVLVLAASLAFYLMWANARWSALPVLRSTAKAAQGSDM